jgi:hypothetical protein
MNERETAYVAMVGNVSVIEDTYVLIDREGTIAIDTYQYEPDKAQYVAEQAMDRLGAGGWVIPDLSTIPVLYR